MIESITDRTKEAQGKGQEIKLGIAIPNNFQMVPSAFMDSFLMMEKPPCVYLRSGASHDLAGLRNGLVKLALEQGCTHIIMMDVDQIYPVDTLTRLLSHNKDIVGGKVHRRYPPFDPLMLKGDINSYENVMEWKKGELVEVDATGTGCLLFNMDVFRNMPAPWFKFRRKDNGDADDVGEDIGFCSDARKAGYKIYVDTGCKIGHLSWMVVSEETHLMYKAMKGELSTACREIAA